MLEDLGIEPEDDVLDAGLGTGYQAALILKLVAGPDRLTACDISGTDAARDRLEALGHHPRIIEADATSWRWQRQFDKIIFSFGLPYVTDSIRTALAPGGRLIAKVFGPMSAGLVLLEARSDGTLSGRFTEDGGAFMPARRGAGAVRAEPGERSGGTSGIPVEDFDNYHLKFLLSARLPGLDLQYGRVGRSAACSCPTAGGAKGPTALGMEPQEATRTRVSGRSSRRRGPGGSRTRSLPGTSSVSP